jgi:hypothetical protein
MRLCPRTQVVMPVIASRMIMHDIIPRVSKTNGIESTPSPICVFIMRIDVPIQPTYVRNKDWYSRGNRDCDLRLSTANERSFVSMPSEVLRQASLCDSHWVHLLECHQRRHL